MADGIGGGSGIDVRRFRVEGRVQGVGFRWWTRKTAKALRLSGRVRNEPDGSVDVRAAGTADALDRLEEALRRGPAPSDVAKVERLAVGTGLRDEASTWTAFEIERA